MKLLHFTLAGLVAASLLGACNDDDPVQGRPLSLTPAAINGAAEVNTRLIAEALWDAQRWLDDSITLTDLRDVLLPSEAAEEPHAAGGASFFVFEEEEDADFEATVDDVVAFLDERVFLDDAVEAVTDTQVVYRLRSATFCDPEWEEEDAYDSCVELLDSVELRLAVTSYAQGDLDIAVLIGATRREVAVVELHQTLAAVTLRVGPALEAALEIDHALNGDDEGYVAPTLTGSGSVRVAARRLTETRLRVAVEVPGDVEVHATMPDEAEPFVLSSGPGSISLDVDRTAATGQLDADLRDLAVRGPKHLLDDLGGGSAVACVAIDGEMGDDAWGQGDCDYEEEEPVAGTFELQLTRVAGLVDLSDELQELAITGLIVGPVALLLDDARVFGADLDGGLVPIDVAFTASDDRADIALSHGATLATVWRMESAADLWPDLADSFLAYDDLAAGFGGDTPWISVRSEGLMVESGSLTLTSSARPDLDRTIEAGVCAWYDDGGDWGEGGDAPPTATEGSPVPDDTDDGDDGGHPFDFETGASCPEGEEIPPPFSGSDAG